MSTWPPMGKRFLNCSSWKRLALPMNQRAVTEPLPSVMVTDMMLMLGLRGGLKASTLRTVPQTVTFSPTLRSRILVRLW
ncbi:hypothetical protein D3C86_1629820 [compost metagenome]